MKVKCINKDVIYLDTLTINKIYEVIDRDSDNIGYKIKDDTDNNHWYPKKWFESKSEIRNDKINKLLGE